MLKYLLSGFLFNLVSGLKRFEFPFDPNQENSNDLKNKLHLWEDFKWEKEGEQLEITVGDCHTPSTINWSKMLKDVIYNWNNIPENQDGSGIIYRPSNVTFKSAPCLASMVESYNGLYLFPCGNSSNWLGCSILHTDDDHKIIYSQTFINEVNNLKYDNWQHVLCHEIGHSSPMDHPSITGEDTDSCMDYDKKLSNKYPNKLDWEVLNYLYSK